MGRPRKYHPRLGPLLECASFSTSDAKARGVPGRALAYLASIGELERIGPGIYRNASYESEIHPLLEDSINMVTTTPNSVICLISALLYYELTEEVPRENWVAIPNSQYAPTRAYVRIVRMRNTTTGKQTIRIDGVTVAIFNRERCIVDAFRYLSREVAIKALQAYLRDRSHKPNLKRLSQYAKKLRVNIAPYILALTT